MGLRKGWRAKIWKVDKRDKFTVVEMTTSTKAQDGNYYTDWRCSHTMLVGKAHEANIEPGDMVTIGDFEVRNKYDEEKKTTYTDYKIFDFEEIRKREGAPAEKPIKKEEPKQEDEDELPFN